MATDREDAIDAAISIAQDEESYHDPEVCQRCDVTAVQVLIDGQWVESGEN